MEEKIIVPYAPILVESSRSIGYSFETALADIIDNSISAGACDIQVDFSSRDPQWLRVQDNGCGMSAGELEAAMRYGSRSPGERREAADLGRFGLGLKTASLSQCRKLTVISKKDGHAAAACWDLERILQTGQWTLQTWAENELADLPAFATLKKLESGTVVQWENFDRLRQEAADVQDAFDNKIALARDHVALVFHRFLNPDSGQQRINIAFNGNPAPPLDPFLVSHPSAQPLPDQILWINGESIRVKAYVLPSAGKLKKKHVDSMGGAGDMSRQQGFYIYRNRRLIIWGTWFRLMRRHELGRLARVKVDIPNTLYAIWDIDVKKSTASLPSSLRAELARIVRDAAGRSERVYSYKGRNLQTDSLTHVWNVSELHGAVRYSINRDLAIYKMLEDNLPEKALPLLESFAKILETSFPFADAYYRLAKNEKAVRAGTMAADEVYSVAAHMIGQIRETGGSVQQFLASLDSVDFFAGCPDVIAAIREDYNDD